MTGDTTTPWHPMNNPVDIKHLGKLLEEIGEWNTAFGKASFYRRKGFTQQNHSFGADHNVELRVLTEETADVQANVRLVLQHFNVTSDREGDIAMGRDLALAGEGVDMRLSSLVNTAAARIARVLIQGLDGSDPKTGKPNRPAFARSLHILLGAMQAARIYFDLDREAISLRTDEKMKYLQRVHAGA